MSKLTLKMMVEQIKALRATLILLFIPVGVIVGILILAQLGFDIPMRYLTRDPGDLLKSMPVDSFPFLREGFLDLPFYISGVSYIGWMIWAAAAAICFFGFVSLRKVIASVEGSNFLLASALLSTLLLVDDIFRIHEVVFPRYLGLPEFSMPVIYAFLALFILIFFRKIIFQSEFILLYLGLGFLGLSLASDFLTDYFQFFRRISGATLFEDGAKLSGAVLWLGYYWRFAAQRIRHFGERGDQARVGRDTL